MPIRIPNDLPAAQVMQQENIFVMEHQRATTQQIRPLEIVVLNLMPEWIEEREQTRSMSGSMYRYDTQVPLIIYGAGCKAQLRRHQGVLRRS